MRMVSKLSKCSVATGPDLDAPARASAPPRPGAAPCGGRRSRRRAGCRTGAILRAHRSGVRRRGRRFRWDAARSAAALRPASRCPAGYARRPAGIPRRRWRLPQSLRRGAPPGLPTFSAIVEILLAARPRSRHGPSSARSPSTSALGDQAQHLGRLLAHVLGAGMAGDDAARRRPRRGFRPGRQALALGDVDDIFADVEGRLGRAA